MHRAGVSRAPFGQLPDGRAVELFTLTNAHGIEVRAMTYGAIITSIRTPDRTGTPADIALGFDSLGGYLAGSPYFGAVVGRYRDPGPGGSRRAIQSGCGSGTTFWYDSNRFPP